MTMRERRHLYPDDWEALATQVKAEAGWRCEQCGHPHAPDTDHVLTVHHIDGDTAHNAPANLVALCQRCHLSIHRRGMVGQRMFDFAVPDWLRRRGVRGYTGAPESPARSKRSSL